MDVILSTRNPSKAEQIKAVFEGSPIRVLTLADAGIEGEATEDTGGHATLGGNARLKALFAHEHAPDTWTMADDTGIFIDAVGGEPGVDAAYWGGASLSTEERAAYCLKRLEGAADRSATFRTMVVMVAPDGAEHSFTGEVRGKILEAPRMQPQPKMPYSAIFVPDGETKSWAEMDTAHENSVSHRGKAFRQVRAFLEALS